MPPSRLICATSTAIALTPSCALLERRYGSESAGHRQRFANHLLRYSERGMDYVKEIQSMIRINKLAALDGV